MITEEILDLKQFYNSAHKIIPALSIHFIEIMLISLYIYFRNIPMNSF